MRKGHADPNDLIEQTAKSRAEEQKEKDRFGATADCCGLGCPLSCLRQGVVHVPNSDHCDSLVHFPNWHDRCQLLSWLGARFDQIESPLRRHARAEAPRRVTRRGPPSSRASTSCLPLSVEK